MPDCRRANFQRACVNLLQSSVAAGQIEQARAQLGTMDAVLAGAPPRLSLLTELEARALRACRGRSWRQAAAALDRAALHAPESIDAFERVEIAEAQAEFALARGDAANAAALLAPIIARYADDDLAAREVPRAARAGPRTGGARPRR